MMNRQTTRRAVPTENNPVPARRRYFEVARKARRRDAAPSVAGNFASACFTTIPASVAAQKQPILIGTREETEIPATRCKQKAIQILIGTDLHFFLGRNFSKKIRFLDFRAPHPRGVCAWGA